MFFWTKIEPNTKELLISQYLNSINLAFKRKLYFYKLYKHNTSLYTLLYFSDPENRILITIFWSSFFYAAKFQELIEKYVSYVYYEGKKEVFKWMNVWMYHWILLPLLVHTYILCILLYIVCPPHTPTTIIRKNPLFYYYIQGVHCNTETCYSIKRPFL